MPDLADKTHILRRRLELRGQVQGVGFRPSVYRLATGLGLTGFVANDTHGAAIEIEGPAGQLDAFERALVAELPPLAHITSLERRELRPLGDTEFCIRESAAGGDTRPEVAPDAATCADCRRELSDAQDRRYRYPFINCTNCGPRYSIIRDVPYDRPQTTMSAFRMCAACQAEYDDPANRRFHAQPNACPECGPRLALLRVKAPPHPGVRPAVEPFDGDVLEEAARLLRDGAIVAIKGIGGYHLACRADRGEVVERLRERKLRDGKPLAIMVANLAAARTLCALSQAEEEALESVAAPIVLATRRPDARVASNVAPGCAELGLMLPYAPVHHLLFAAGLGPLVLTSANLSGQPLTFRDDDALASLTDVADALLVHDREIFRPIDDSVVQVFREAVVPLRRARGYAPRPLQLPASVAPLAKRRRILAVGGELKSTVCLLHGREAVLSEHLGDLSHPDTYRHFVRAIERLEQLFDFTPDLVACDLHPNYLSTAYAQQLGLPVVGVQHHHAHIASVMAEAGVCGPVVGLACDGTGYGPDGAVWGGEVLVCARGNVERVGQLTYFPLVGGDQAALETWRPAAALLRQIEPRRWQEWFRAPVSEHIPSPTATELRIFAQQLEGGLNAPPSSSLGRVFDAVSYLLGVCGRNRHEAEAAMALESVAREVTAACDPLPFELREEDSGWQLDLRPAIGEIARTRAHGAFVALLAARFHETVAQLLCTAARRVCDVRSIPHVALSGGCFANRRLLERVVTLLEASGLKVLRHAAVPAGDGGVALGQALVASWRHVDGRA